MMRNHIAALIVTDGGEPVGLVSERDLVSALAEKGSHAADTPVCAAITGPVLAVSRNESLTRAMAMMTGKRVRHLPVFENSELVGIVSMDDLIKYRLEEIELESKCSLISPRSAVAAEVPKEVIFKIGADRARIVFPHHYQLCTSPGVWYRRHHSNYRDRYCPPRIFPLGLSRTNFSTNRRLELFAAILLATSSARSAGVALAAAVNFIAVILLLKNRAYFLALPGLAVMTALPSLLFPFAERWSSNVHIDLTVLTPVAALVGGSASLIAAIYTQRTQHRLQRVTTEITRRESVYAEFVMSASNLLVNAHILDDIALNGDEQRLIGLINRMRLFASQEVLASAETVLKTILGIYLKPKVELRQLAIEALADGALLDPLLPFSSGLQEMISTKSAIPCREHRAATA